MKTMLMVWMFISLCLSFGCTTNEAEPRSDKTSVEGVGQVEQEICYDCEPPITDCDCPLGTRASGQSCVGYFVVGPTANPCVADCQCGSGYRCTGGPYPSYGQCVSIFVIGPT
jgi:hypothetical protein